MTASRTRRSSLQMPPERYDRTEEQQHRQGLAAELDDLRSRLEAVEGLKSTRVSLAVRRIMAMPLLGETG